VNRRASSAGASTDALMLPIDAEVSRLTLDLGRMIEAARQQVAQAANAGLAMLYWQFGKRVQTEVLEGRRAEYAARIVAAVWRQLEGRHGRASARTTSG